jgi:SOS-response transcriptional repressor LexA
MNKAIKTAGKPLSSDEQLLINLRLLMHKKNFSEAKLSRETHIPQPTLHKILSGKTSDPRISTLKILAHYFEITLDDLYSLDVLKSIHTTDSEQSKSIPIISWEDCVKSDDPTASLSSVNWDQWAVIANTDNKAAYALISKPSMEPRFPRGTTLIIDVDVQPSDGDLVIVYYPETKQATLRELSMDGPHRLLLSLNQNLPADQLTNTIKILGTVAQSRFTY